MATIIQEEKRAALPARLAVMAGFAVAAMPLSGMPAGKTVREEGQYRIFAGGREVGLERYMIAAGPDAAMSTSTVDFRSPANSRQKIHFETRLEMDERYLPRAYELKSEIDGKKGAIVGSFASNQAMFEYRGDATPRKSGLLMGDQFTLLDSNVFHHFVFLARLFDFESDEKTQRFEVAIPQETDSGFLKITEIKKESIVVRGKKVELHQLQADSGALRIQLWVDDLHVLRKIIVKDKDIEVRRDP